MMKVKTDFKQMVLVDHILYNKINSISKPDVHIQQVRTPITNPIPPNSNHPHTSPPPSSNLAPPPPNYPGPSTAHSSDLAPPPTNYSAHPTAPISEPHPSIPVSNNEWEKQAHQWIDTIQQSNYMNYNDMDKSAQTNNNSNTAQSELLGYTNTHQRAAISTTESNVAAPSQISFEKPMEI